MRITAYALVLMLLPSLGLVSCAEQAGDQATGEMKMGMETGFDVAEVRAAIAEAQAQLLGAFEAGDAAGISALYTEDATVYPPNAETVTGRAAIEEFWGAFIALGVENLTVNTLDVGGGGDVAYETGEYSLTVSGEGGEPTADRGTYIVILKRGADGSWNVYAHIWNSDLPLE